MRYQNTNMFRITSIFLTILFIGLLSASITHAESYSFVTKWGFAGKGDGQFDNPTGIAVDNSGNVYVADFHNHRIQKFDSNGNFITKWGSSGTSDGQFRYPSDIAIDSSGNVYVADHDNNRIQKFSSDDGKNYKFVSKFGSFGDNDGQFNFPEDIAIDAFGNIYVADTNNHRVQKFSSSDGRNYNFVTKWGSYGTGDGQFHTPSGIAVDSSGNIYVADTFNHRIQKFDSKGSFITKWGPEGSVVKLYRPYGIGVDSSGNVYIPDGHSHIQKFDSVGNFITIWGSQGNNDGQFWAPYDVAIDSSGKVYVVDFTYNRVQKFVKNNSVISVLPLANFSTNVTKGYAPLSVKFTDLSKNATSRRWNFGDGTNSTLQNPIHIYSKTGNFTVNLTAVNANGTNSKTAIITVSAKPALPVANFASNVTSGYAPLNVAFTDKSTGTPTSWNWTFGDGTCSSIKNTIHTYSKAGNYTVKLTVKNTAGSNTTTKANYIKVATVIKPVANFTSNLTSGYVPLNVAFTDKSTNSPTAWKWTFGDGTNSTVKNPVHKYSTKGNYTVSLTASNAAGSSTITKNNYIKITTVIKPVANFISNVTSGYAPLNVAFTDKSTNTPTSWRWTFGDGTNSTIKNPVHRYSTAGNYTVTLTASNSAGSSTTTKTNYVKVIKR